MELPLLPPAPRAVPPALERRIATRGTLFVFWSYVFMVCGLAFLFSGIYGANLTIVVSGAVLCLFGLGTLLVRRLTLLDVPRLLREGDWTPGRITRIEPGPRSRRLHYAFGEHSGVFAEDKPWDEEFAEGREVAVLHDPTIPSKSVPLAPHQVEAACECWKLAAPR